MDKNLIFKNRLFKNIFFKNMFFIFISLSLITSLIMLSSCNKSKVEATDRIYCLNGEIYSNDGVDGMILTGVINYVDLGVNRKNILCYGFAYAFFTPSKIDPLYLGNDNIHEITIDDVDKHNQVNCIIDVPEEYYNADISFRLFFKYLDKDGNEHVMYSLDYNAANLYELALKDPGEFAKKVVESVEKNKKQ